MAESVFLVDIDAPRPTIREALTSEKGIRSWWTADATVTGERLDLGFPDAPSRFALRVDEVGDETVRWTSIGDFPPHWVGTDVRWQLMDHPSGSGSQIFFAHAGFAAADPMLGHTAYTWAQLMGHLKRYAESGEAGPFFG